VPGWYAMASIKWLRRIIVTSKPFAGYYQSIDYSYWERSNGELPTLKPLAEQQIKAEIARPESGEAVAANTIVKVHGAAWGGSAEIIKVEIRADGGKAWNAARLLGGPGENRWRLWEKEWRRPPPPARKTPSAPAPA